jgi:CSLREA domain-containing protein
MHRHPTALAGFLVALLVPCVASALTFTVGATTDAADANLGDMLCAAVGGACTLRAAVQEANDTAGADTIVLPAGTYALTHYGALEDAAATGDLDVTSDVTIEGAGASSERSLYERRTLESLESDSALAETHRPHRWHG